jgi:hypothetical protein
MRVNMCVHRFGQGEQGSTPSGAGVREQNTGGERERLGAATQSRWLRCHTLGY